jgi:hypothetical protein
MLSVGRWTFAFCKAVSLVSSGTFGFAERVPSYRIAPLFLIRVAGVPFGLLETATRETLRLEVCGRGIE